MHSMVNYFKGYCGELFEDTEIAFSFQVTGTIQEISVSPEIRRNLFLILKEACNNVMKHSGATKVVALFHYDKEQISLSVIDNGCGYTDLPASDMMNSSGLKNMKRRAGDIGFSFTISGTEKKGCSIIVTGSVS
jgi:two-component system sensor histidine kinase UhpB